MLSGYVILPTACYVGEGDESSGVGGSLLISFLNALYALNQLDWGRIHCIAMKQRKERRVRERGRWMDA